MYPTKHYLYPTWNAMRQRCSNENHPKYKDYGGRGIGVCEHWLDFWNFVEDMGDRPEGFSLERRDNDGDYTPENCVWANSNSQRLNQRMRINNSTAYIRVKSDPYNRSPKRYGVSVSIDGKSYFFGWYTNIINAAYVADQMVLAIYGEDVPMNFLGNYPRHSSYVDK